ncbi:MAG: efflux RND transporter permease subunit [Polyangiaceae bacterium]|nr:efflux RND transporter permease subunit [Polyangiaceae bacterium]MCW5792007.1 efflux RND transporter permease subunit [Polyangiaceae bacterium]
MLAALLRLCAERRVATLLVTLVIAVFGVRAYLKTPVEAFPDVTNLQVNVIAQQPGLAPPEIERQITIPLERELNGLPKLVSMRSESLFGLSLVYLTFEDGADPFKSRVLVSERIGGASLPDGVQAELGPDATPLGQIYQYHLRSPRHSLSELRSEQEWVIAPALRRVEGVADVVTRGGFLKELHVEVDPTRLIAFDLTLEQVEEAITRSNRNAGGGVLPRGEQQLVVRGVGAMSSSADLGSVVLKHHEGTPVTLADIARVVQSHTPRQGTVGYDLEDEAVAGAVFMRRGSNPSDVLEGVHRLVEELNGGDLPEGMQIVPLYDRSELVGQTLQTVHKNLLEAALLVVGVVWLFIRSLKGSLIVASVIPLSLLVAFIGLSAIGLPANLISMGAIDFGILVDGGVILVESVIHRLRAEQPKTRGEMLSLVVRAGLEVARPTFFAMTIIIAALIPVLTLERVEGRIFRPLGLTYGFALIGAMLLAFTVVPALCALVMRVKDGHAEEPRTLVKLRSVYLTSVEWLLRRRVLGAALGLALFTAAGVTAARLGSEFLPELDEGDILVFVEMPSSISLARGQELLREARQLALTVPEVQGVETRQGRPEDGTDNESVNMAVMPVRLKPRAEWGAPDKAAIEAELRRRLEVIPGARFNFSQPMKDSVEEAISGVRGKVVLKIFGTDLEVMRQALQEALEVIGRIPGVTDLSLYRDRSVPQLEIVADRPALARAGIDMSTLQDTLETSLAGRVVTEIWEGERAVPVRLRLPREAREDLTRIGELSVTAPSGARIPLADLTTIQVVPGRASINREANSRSLALKFNVEGRDMGSVVKEAMSAVKADVAIPEGYRVTWGGEFENQHRAMSRLAVVVPLSLAVVFTLLVMALGSARSALVVMCVVPLSLTGGVFALALTGINLSVSAAVGFIALLGQVSLAALLVVGAVDERRRAGDPMNTAILEGAGQRFRAVLMLAALAMLGLLPMAISTGVGSETQRPFAVVLIGGMVTTLGVVLLILPLVYRTLARRDGPPAGDGGVEVAGSEVVGAEHVASRASEAS